MNADMRADARTSGDWRNLGIKCHEVERRGMTMFAARVKLQGLRADDAEVARVDEDINQEMS
jgi:hypothetical protein